MQKLIASILVFFIRIYQYTLSPFLGQACRYTPSCSAYSVEALKKHGPIYGSWLAIKRVSSCHPWGGSGYNPVPEKLNKKLRFNKFKMNKTWLMAALISWIAVPLAAQNENNFEISKNLEIYTDLLRELNLNYVDPINPGELSKTSIDAMLSDLDPYTVYIPESQIEDYKLWTTGEYGGIGALIQRMGDWVYIAEPYEGFPAQKAGLKAGDKILEINGKSAEQKSTADVSDFLKGAPGTKIEIKIERHGNEKPMDVELIREKIKIDNIPYSGVLEGDIGYIQLRSFTQRAGAEVKNSLSELQKQAELKGLIIDLRGNGGGLLNEAVNIVNLFIEKGMLVVTTKGKSTDRTSSYRTQMPVYDADIPLVILVNEGSASASEIVAGAIQDYDRGLVVGQKTFGKGLVQNVVPLSYNSKVKITVSKYYIPSGRCIQAINYSANGGSDQIPDSLKSAFKTANGRLVYDGGGIMPDVKLKDSTFSLLSAQLFAQQLIFRFVNDFASRHDSIDPPGEFAISDDLFDEFVAYVKADSLFDYKTESELMLDQFINSTTDEKYYDELSSYIDQIKQQLEEEKSEDMQVYRKEIEMLLTSEIIGRYYFQKGKAEAALKDDKEVKECIRLLKEQEQYTQLLSAPK